MTNDISVDINELINVNNKSKELKEEIKTTFNHINSKLSYMESVIKSNSLTKSNEMFASNLDDLMASIDRNLDGINEFLSEQIGNYNNVVEETLASIRTLIEKLNDYKSYNINSSYL